MKKQILNIKLTRATKNGNYPKIIYKYLTLNSALKLLQNNTLLFSNPAAWQDPYEKKVVEAKFVVDGKTLDFPLKDKVFAACFTEQYSCEAQWRAYAYGKKDVVVELAFDMGKLLNALLQMDTVPAFGKMKYCRTVEFSKEVTSCLKSKVAKKALLSKKWDSINNLKYTLRPLYLKRVAFAYENEWRIFLTELDLFSSSGLQTIPNLCDSIDSIIIGPCKDNVQFNKAKSKIIRFLPNVTIHQSYIRKEGKTKMKITL